MPDLFVTKHKMAKGYALVPAHETDEEAVKKLPVGRPLRCKITQIRNVDFHRKYFALLNYAYDCWEPPDECPDWLNAVEKNFDRFRADIIILCGYFDAHYRLNGEVRIEPKSISFSSMSQDEFEKLYAETITVIVKNVLNNYTDEALRQVVDKVLEFEG